MAAGKRAMSGAGWSKINYPQQEQQIMNNRRDGWSRLVVVSNQITPDNKGGAGGVSRWRAGALKRRRLWISAGWQDR